MLYDAIRSLPIVSPHGHTVPQWFSDDLPFADPADLLIIPDHYVFRMLYSQGVALEDLGIGVAPEKRDPRAIFRHLAQHWHLFMGTPSRGWLEHTLRAVFGITETLGPDTSDVIYDQIAAKLSTAQFRPVALLESFGIELLATTDGALDDLSPHASFARKGRKTRLIPTFRPDSVLDPMAKGWSEAMAQLGALTGEDCTTMAGWRAALMARRQHFIHHGATATDHAIDHLATEWLEAGTAQKLLEACLRGRADDAAKRRLYNHMLIEMAQMSIDDGLVMQLHAGSARGTNRALTDRFGADKGADIPLPQNWVRGADGLLNRVGNDAKLTLIAFTLDESVYARELAPMAGHWPALRLGPPWWFHDSPNGIRRYLDAVVESAGYWNLAGFNDDTRALMSIPARHDMWRRAVAEHLDAQIAAGRFGMTDAERIAQWLAVGAARAAYRL
ncbi:Uronate isomerase [Roseobacter fucihabitans]|uniref:Uronate isomerase n=1 Tax=Roseobacter fucihabitans TaxID=1537242 RepID=A0ABZ2BSC3_9RHOB|nr:glucuronate isomerase [Roseobacter litoralis]MBC6964173.1 Uronate isomerase [Roseobacter litoralis]